MKSAKQIAQMKSGRSVMLGIAGQLGEVHVDKQTLLDWERDEEMFLAGFDLAIEMLRSEEADKYDDEMKGEIYYARQWADWLEKQRG